MAAGWGVDGAWGVLVAAELGMMVVAGLEG